MKRAPPDRIELSACGLGILADPSAARSAEAYSVNDGQDRNDSATTPPQAGGAANSAQSVPTRQQRATHSPRFAAVTKASAKERVLAELRGHYDRNLGILPADIAWALVLSEATVRRYLNALVAEGKARRIGYHDACYQWRAPKYGPITASEASRLAGQAALNDHHHLMDSAGELVRGGNLEAAHAELDRAAERYRAYLATLPESEVAP